MKRYLLTLIPLLPLLFFTSKYNWLINYIIYVFILSINFSYMGLDYVEILEKILDEPSNLLFSEEQPSDEKFNEEFKKSLVRVRDFIKIAKKDGSGTYPEDFNYTGYKRDDGSFIHSKAPKDWGIDELYDFGNYNDLTKRKQSALQLALWLEYDCKVNERRFVNISSNDNTLNSSGTEWFRKFCDDNHLREDNTNTLSFRKDLRKFALKK